MCSVLNSCSDRVTFFMVFNNIVEPKSGVTILNSIVDNIEHVALTTLLHLLENVCG